MSRMSVASLVCLLQHWSDHIQSYLAQKSVLSLLLRLSVMREFHMSPWFVFFIWDYYFAWQQLKLWRSVRTRWTTENFSLIFLMFSMIISHFLFLHRCDLGCQLINIGINHINGSLNLHHPQRSYLCPFQPLERGRVLQMLDYSQIRTIMLWI